MFFSKFKKPVPESHDDLPRSLPAIGSSLNFPMYRSAEPLPTEIDDSSVSRVSGSIDVAPMKDYYLDRDGPNYPKRYDVKKMSTDVGIIVAELSLDDGTTYVKKFTGEGPDPKYFARDDEKYPGILLISRSSSAIMGIEFPFMKVQFAKHMYASWLKDSHERGYFRIELSTTSLYVFDNEEGPVLSVKEFDIPVKRVRHIALHKKSNVVTWKELMI